MTTLTLSKQAAVVDKGDNYIRAATSDNTRKAYQADIDHFLEQGGVLPAQPEAIVRYLNQNATTLNPRTLVRRATALRQWHRLQGVDDPTQDPLVVKTLRGIARLHGRPKQQALALRVDDLDKVVAHLSQARSLMSCRDRALLLLGFFGAFRRSELVALQWEHIQFVSDGIIVMIPRSKTDQVGAGQHCVIPFGPAPRCPVRALIAWRDVAKFWEGSIFRQLSKTGNILSKAITAHHINRIVKACVKKAGLPNAKQYSAHSLRRGFATEAARLGASMPSIQRHGRWKTTRTVVEYIEAGRQFKDSAVNVLFDFVDET